MHVTIKKIINLLCLILACAWFLKNPDWEPAITFLGLLAVLIGQAFLPQFNRVKERDKLLARKFLDEFPSNCQSCQFLKDHDIGNPFHNNSLKAIEKFVDTWGDAEHVFGIKIIEEIKKSLYEKCSKFLPSLYVNVSPAYRPDMLTMGMKDWEDRKEILQKRDELNKMASAIYENHQQLIAKLNEIIA